MRLIVDLSLARGFIPINTWLQRASLPFKPGVLERKVYSYINDDKTLFSVLRFADSECDKLIMCCFAVLAASHYHTQSWQMLINGFAVQAATHYHTWTW